MPFSLQNVLASFQRSIDIPLAPVRFKLDDIVIFSRNVEEQLDNVETVLSSANVSL